MNTTGQTIASNLHGCQIISGRDVERVAKQIDRAALRVAQNAFEEWLKEIDAELSNGSLAFEEGMGAGQNGDAEAAAGAFLRARSAINNTRQMIALGLAIGS